MTPPVRLVIAVSHPVQHFAPFYRALANDGSIDLHVMFTSPVGVKAYFDAEMQSEISWNMDLLGGYAHEFLMDDASAGQPGFFAMNSPELGARLTALKPDAVLIYGYAQINALRAILWCWWHKVPALLISDSELRKTRSLWKRVFKRVVVTTLFRAYSAFLSVGDENDGYYKAFGAPGNRIFRSPFTIDEGPYREARRHRKDIRARIRNEYGIPEEDRLLLFVGKLSPRKRPGDLVAALKQLAARASGPRYQAMFAGNGTQMAELQAAAAREGVAAHFPGFVNVDRLPEFYAASDVLVHPSAADPHPLVCSEAACVGMPMVLSDRIGAAGPTDIARPGNNALIYPCGDVQAMAAAIETVSGDAAHLAAMSARSEAIFDELDVNASVAGVKKALAAVCNRV